MPCGGASPKLTSSETTGLSTLAFIRSQDGERLAHGTRQATERRDRGALERRRDAGRGGGPGEGGIRDRGARDLPVRLERHHCRDFAGGTAALLAGLRLSGGFGQRRLGGRRI